MFPTFSVQIIRQKSVSNYWTGQKNVNSKDKCIHEALIAHASGSPFTFLKYVYILFPCRKASLCLEKLVWRHSEHPEPPAVKTTNPWFLLYLPCCVITGLLAQRTVMIVSNVYYGGSSWFQWKLCSCFLLVSCGFLHDCSIIV